MMASSLILAASSIIGIAQSIATNGTLEYREYKGDGSAAAGWPTTAEWADFETMFAENVASSPDDCEWLGVGANSDAENSQMGAAIRSAAEESGVDARFILAAVFQESGGCVRVVTSYSSTQGYRNPGLLQCFEGDHTCNDPDAGIPLTDPCPEDQIYGMVTDGVGLTTEDGLMQVIERSGASDDSKFYKGAVLYNSGVLPDSGNLGQGRSNPCYASDMANRLMGWVGGRSPCDRDTIGS